MTGTSLDTVEMTLAHPRHHSLGKLEEELNEEDLFSGFSDLSQASSQVSSENLDDFEPEIKMSYSHSSSTSALPRQMAKFKQTTTAHHYQVHKVRHKRSHGRDLGEQVRHLPRKNRQLGTVVFTEEDLASISRRKPTSKAEQPGNGVAAFRRASISLSNHYKLEDRPATADSIELPTGLRAQQERLSALQKENFDLKLSLHSHRRKESWQTTRLAQVENKLVSAETKTRAMEKKLSTLRGEIATTYRGLEKLVEKDVGPGEDQQTGVEQKQRGSVTSFGESDEPIAKSTDEFLDLISSRSAGTSVEITEKDKKMAIPGSNLAPAPTKRHLYEARGAKRLPSVTDTFKTKTAATPAPTRRHDIETKLEIQRGNQIQNQELRHGQTVQVYPAVSKQMSSRKGSNAESNTARAYIYTGPDGKSSENIRDNHYQGPVVQTSHSSPAVGHEKKTGCGLSDFVARLFNPSRVRDGDGASPLTASKEMDQEKRAVCGNVQSTSDEKKQKKQRRVLSCFQRRRSQHAE